MMKMQVAEDAMPANDDDAFAAMIRKLKRLGEMDADDIAAIRSLPFTIVNWQARDYIVREGQRAEHCSILLSGYACRNKLTREGRRQIVSFQMAGDILDLQHLLLDVADHNVQAITNVVVATVPSAALREVGRVRPRVAAALWRDTLIDASVFREWVLNVGQRDARARVAHMLCEFAIRRAAAGLGPPERFELPMGQEEIADATGMTTVHVNRMLRALAEDGIISRDRRQVQIVDWNRMRQDADFDPAYLHAAA